jgi:hypothetical protein
MLGAANATTAAAAEIAKDRIDISQSSGLATGEPAA